MNCLHVTMSLLLLGKELEEQSRGNETFSYGQHSGETFAKVAEADPTYHSRYLRAIHGRGKSCPSMLSRYVKYSELVKDKPGGKHKFARHLKHSMPQKRRRS